MVNEQTAYQTPGNSHTSRQASAELQFAILTGDKSNYDKCHQTTACYLMVDVDGKNNYPGMRSGSPMVMAITYGTICAPWRMCLTWLQTMPIIFHSTSVILQADYYPDFNNTWYRMFPYAMKRWRFTTVLSITVL
ncbi:MAG: hypothetical protein U5K79_11170 [Cyclobacteriaceae bacterium]|nr:hypothetical protein [Cyclobacteriaceae bacterium]